MLRLHVGDVRCHLIALGIGDHAFIGIILVTGILWHTDLQCVGLGAGSIETIFLQDLPIRRTIAVVPLIGQGAGALGCHSEGPQIVGRVQWIILGSDVHIRNLRHHTLRLLQNQNDLLAVKTTDGADAVLVIDVGSLVGNMAGFITETAGAPMVGVADFPGALGCCRVGAIGV